MTTLESQKHSLLCQIEIAIERFETLAGQELTNLEKSLFRVAYAQGKEAGLKEVLK